MGKFLLMISVMCLMFLGIGTSIYPSASMFWLSSGSMAFQIIRSIMIIFLLAQIFTNPPRHLWFRLISGIVAVSAAVWTVQATFTFQMSAMDTFAFLAGSTALLVVALERSFATTIERGLNKQKNLQGALQDNLSLI